MKLRQQFAIASIVFCALCIVLRFWPSDLWRWSAPFAYVPSFFLLFWMLLQLFFVRLYRSWYIVMIGALLFFVGLREHKHDYHHGSGTGSLRVMHWNVWSVRRGLQEITEEISKQKPDVVLLNEPADSKRKQFPPYTREMENRTGVVWYGATENKLAVLSKYPVIPVEKVSSSGIDSLLVTIQSPKPVRILLMDVSPRFEVSRMTVYQRVHLGSLKPDLVGGDFNTPAHARSMAPFHQQFLDPHCGLGYTWPTLAPMLRIDHLWVRRGINILRHDRGLSLLSDHAWQLVEIES